MNSRLAGLLATGVVAAFAFGSSSHAASVSRSQVTTVVEAAVRPVMAKDGIPGMAVGLTVDGKSYVFNYGVASKATGQPVTGNTLFEIGSVSKTFTATLAAYAQRECDLSLADKVGKYLPSLRGTPFGNVSLLSLGTHTPGGLPLQVPDDVHDDAQLLRYLQAWRPTYAQGTMRTYTNIGIGTLGLITAKSMGADFSTLMEQRLFPALGMKDSYIHIPADKMADYAQGYTEDEAPIRMAPGELSAEAYGARTTAADMLRFVEANLGMLKVDRQFQRAIIATHTGYFRAGAFTQDLIWEQYAWPVTLHTLLEGNSPRMIFHPAPVAKLVPPEKPRSDVWINKTGSTNGFGAYVAFVPSQRLGIVILANKSYPIADRITIAYEILGALAKGWR